MDPLNADQGTTTHDVVSGGGVEYLGPGDVYVYEYDGSGAWALAERIQPSGVAQEGWGLTAAIGGDVLVLGVAQSSASKKLPAYVYVYRRHGTSWTEEARLTPPGDAEAKILSGTVSVRGKTIAIGDYCYKNESAGRVFIYKFDPSSKSWNPVDGDLCSKS